MPRVPALSLPQTENAAATAEEAACSCKHCEALPPALMLLRLLRRSSASCGSALSSCGLLAKQHSEALLRYAAIPADDAPLAPAVDAAEATATEAIGEAPAPEAAQLCGCGHLPPGAATAAVGSPPARASFFSMLHLLLLNAAEAAAPAAADDAPAF